MNSVYISFSDGDSALAGRISGIIRQCGFKSYVDRANVSAEIEHANQTATNIKNCSFVIFIVSNSSLNSQWCRREIEFAVQRRKEIIPILSGVTEQEVKASWLANYVKNVRWFNETNIDEGQLLEYLSEKRKFEFPEPELSAPLPSSIPIPPAPCDNFTCPPVQEAPVTKSGKSSWSCCLYSALVLIVLAVIFAIFFASSSESPMPEPVYDSEPFPETVDGQDTVIIDDDGAIMDEDATSSDPYPAADEEESVIITSTDSNENNSFWIIAIGLIVAIIIPLYFLRNRKVSVKLVANKDCDVFADNLKIATLSGNTVKTVKLKKGTYYLSFKPNDKSTESQFISYTVNKQNDLINISFPEPKQSDNSGRKSIKCFIAGSTKLESERDTLRAAIAQTHNQWAGKNIEILSYTYEDFERTVVEGGHQHLYDDFIANDATIAVFIISGEIGEFTITEFEKALNAYKTGKHPQILVFNNELAGYHEQAETLKKMVSEEKQYWVDYDSLKALKLQFMSTLNWLLVDQYYKVR